MGIKTIIRSISPNRKQILSLVIVFQILSAALITPVSATATIDDDDSTISVSELIAWLKSTASHQLNSLDSTVSAVIKQISFSDKFVIGNEQHNSTIITIDWSNDKLPDDRNCSPDSTETSKTDKESGDTNCGNSSPSNQDEDTDKNRTVDQPEGSTTIDNNTPSRSQNTVSNTDEEHTQYTSSSPTDESSVPTGKTIDGTHTEFNSGKSQESKSRQNIQRFETLPDINSPIFALIGALCVIGGLLALTRR